MHALPASPFGAKPGDYICIKIHVYKYTDDSMGTKNISLKESAYERLASLKREDESFSDVVERLTEKRTPKYSDLSGTLSKETIEAIENTRKKRKETDETGFEEIVDQFEGEGR